MKIIQAVVAGPILRKKVLPLPEYIDQPISQTWTICVFDTELGECEYILTDKKPVGMHWEEDFSRIGIGDVDHFDEAHMPKNWSSFTKSSSRTMRRATTVKDDTLTKGGDPNFRIPKPVHSFSSEAEHRRIYDKSA